MGFGVQVVHVLLGGGQHAAGAAGGVEHRPYRGRASEGLLVLGEQDVHHQLDDLARGEVFTGGLVLHFGEAPQQLFEDVAHRVVRYDLRVQVDVGELGDHLVEQAGLVEGVDAFGEAVLVEHVRGVGGEPRDVGAEVLADVARVVEQVDKVQRGGVVERRACDAEQDRVDVGDLALQRLRLRDHVGLGRLQHAVEAAQHHERQDELAELVLAHVASQQVGDRPDERDLVVEPLGIRHVRDIIRSPPDVTGSSPNNVLRAGCRWSSP